MNTLILTGSILAVLTYFPLWKGIRSGEVRQNLLSWVLWAILDGVVAATIIAQKGNLLLPVTYAVGSTITSFLIIRSGKKASWTWFETMVALLVVVSMGVWYLSGDKVATVASTMAMVVAGIPQLVDAWKKPQDMPFFVFVSYFIANCLSTAGGKNWSIEERFYPAFATLYCFVMLIFSARKLWLKRELKSSPA